MNIVILTGKLVTELDIVSEKYAKIQLCVKRPYPFRIAADGTKLVDFFEVRVIGKAYVEKVNKLWCKGANVKINGIMCVDKFLDRNTGVKRPFPYVILREFEFDSKSEELTDEEDYQAIYMPGEVLDDTDYSPFS